MSAEDRSQNGPRYRGEFPDGSGLADVESHGGARLHAVALSTGKGQKRDRRFRVQPAQRFPLQLQGLTRISEALKAQFKQQIPPQIYTDDHRFRNVCENLSPSVAHLTFADSGKDGV